MKFLSVLITWEGLNYFIRSALKLMNGTEIRFGNNPINSEYPIIGIILGIWLIATGIGLWFRKRNACIFTLVIEIVEIIYWVIAIFYAVITIKVALIDLLSLFIALVIVVLINTIIIFYVRKQIEEIDRGW